MYVYFTYIQLQKSEFSLLMVVLAGEDPTGKSL